MNLTQILSLPMQAARRHTAALFLAVLILLSAMFYPSDMVNDYSVSRQGQSSALVMATEKYGRHINTLLPIVTVIVLRDLTGLKQLAVVTIAGVVASHGPKRWLNDVTVLGTRLGQRPRSPASRHNMPSGHSTLASAGAYYMMRRYSILFSLIVFPVMLLTMYARVMLDAHTISATIAGAMTGIVVTSLLTTRWRAAVRKPFMYAQRQLYSVGIIHPAE